MTSRNTDPVASRPWHSIQVDEIYSHLGCAEFGLTEQDVSNRKEIHGLNILKERKALGPAYLFVRQFKSPLLYILVLAAAVSAMVGEWKDAGFILAVLILNAVIGSYQEFQAEKNSRSLKQLLRFRTTVIREGKSQEVPSSEIVPGDLVLLESGNRVPADLRLIDSHDLRVDESLLTGESNTVEKSATSSLPPETPLADHKNMAYAGSLVGHGRGKGIVVATANQTAVGQLAVSLEAEDGKPPLIVRMERFTNWIAISTLVLSLIIGLLHILAGHTLTETFFFVTALAVSAIPEGLPVAITVCLAVAASRMAKRNVIVRKLAAVEGLGSCTLIATDKTGTLTCNELTVQKLILADGSQYEVFGSGFAAVGSVQHNQQQVTVESNPAIVPLLRSVSLCNEASLNFESNKWNWHGDTVDIALLSLARKAGYDSTSPQETAIIGTERAAIPYESENQFAAVFYQSSDSAGHLQAYIKGSPERLLQMCRLDSGQADLIRGWIQQLAAAGLRVLAVASGKICDTTTDRNQKELTATLCNHPQLTFQGLVAMHDPVRPGVFQAIRQCKQAGVNIVMVTGDHKITALSIAKELQLASEESEVCTGQQLESTSPEELGNLLKKTKVYARVTPAQKLQIVSAAKEQGDFVAVTGDGVNDAPALNAANIGVAMGRAGTDVARDAAELVLADDNFASIVNGIEEGRVAYDNIRKIIFLLVAMGAAELLLVFLAILSGLPLPLLPIQLLWLNLVTDGIQGVALAFEPGSGDSLQHAPRPTSEPIFNRLMIQRMAIAVLIAGLGGFFVFYGAIQSGYSVEHARNLLLLTMVLFENFHVGNCRSETKSLLQLSPFRSPMLLYGSLVAFGLHVFSMHLPFMQEVLSVSPLQPSDWLIAVLVASLVLPAIEWHKWWWNRKHATNICQTALVKTESKG